MRIPVKIVLLVLCGITAAAHDFSVLTLLTPDGRAAGCGFFISTADGERLFTVRHLLSTAEAAPRLARSTGGDIPIVPERIACHADRMLFRGDRPPACRRFTPGVPPPAGTPVRIITATGSKTGTWAPDGTVQLPPGQRLTAGESGAPVTLSDGTVIAAAVGRRGNTVITTPVTGDDWEPVDPELLDAELRRLANLRRLAAAFQRLLMPGRPLQEAQFLRLALRPDPHPMRHRALETERRALLREIEWQARRLDAFPFGIRNHLLGL